MLILQIRGSNGSGKSTIVRKYLETKKTEIITLKIGTRAIECVDTGDTIVIGRYDRGACGGCDAAIKKAPELKEAVAKLARMGKKAIIFEGVMYGKTVQFTSEIYRFAKAIRADYLAVCLEPAFECALERVYKRNGGKDINVDTTYRTWKSAIESNAKLRAMGVPIITIDTGTVDEGDMGDILERALKENGAG